MAQVILLSLQPHCSEVAANAVTHWAIGLWTIALTIFFLHFYLFILCVCVWVCIDYSGGGGQKTTLRSQFFASATWVPGIELRSLGLVASIFTDWANSPVPNSFFKKIRLIKIKIWVHLIQLCNFVLSNLWHQFLLFYC